MKRIIVSVINDLSTDQRVHKVCSTLVEMGFNVLLVGRRQRTSLSLNTRTYTTKRMFLFFEKGILFYTAYQIRLFFCLLFNKAEVLVSNDLDTLLPNYFISKIKNIPLVYDTHEIFCEVPELQNNATKKAIWKKLERYLFPKLNYVFTVNESIAKIYQNEYHIPIKVVRNVPMLFNSISNKEVSKEALGIPTDKKIIILQGAGINIDRGAEEALQAMQFIDNAVLLIIGSGDVISILKTMVQDLNLNQKVKFIGKVPFETLIQYTHYADLGLTLDKATNVNYKYSLPNKLFDYIHAGVPVLASDLVELKNIITHYNVGVCIKSHDVKHIADKIKNMLSDESQCIIWKDNAKIAAQQLNWDIEKEQLIAVYKQFL